MASSTRSSNASGGSNRRGGGQQNRRHKRHSSGGGGSRGPGRTTGKGRDRTDRTSSGAGGARSGGVEYSSMPRRQPKPSLWQRLLAFIGLGGSGKKPKKAPADRAKESSKPKLRSTAVPGKPAAKKARKERPAERVEVTTPRLYLGNLSYDASESDLQELLNGVGTVKDIEVIYNSHTQRSKGYAFANMMSVDEARRAVDELHGKDYMGRKLVVSGARAPRQEREVA